MAAFYSFYPPSGAASANASVGPNGDPIPTSSTLIAGEGPGGVQTPIQATGDGSLQVNDTNTYNAVFDFSAKTASGLVTVSFDEQVISYVTSGPATGEINQIIYKEVGSTVSTVTLSYNGSGQLVGVVRS